MIALHETQTLLLQRPLDIPTAMTKAEARTLYGLAQGKRVLEFGSLLGHSTIILAQAATKVYAVDPHEGYPVDDPRPTLNEFLANLTKHGVSDRVVPILARGQDVAHLFAPRSFGLVFIDITRSAGELINLAHDLEPDIIAVHDFGIERWDGATIAVRNYAARIDRQFKLVDTLAYFEGAHA